MNVPGNRRSHEQALQGEEKPRSCPGGINRAFISIAYDFLLKVPSMNFISFPSIPTPYMVMM